MHDTTTVFGTDDGGQAVRLPAVHRVDAQRMWIGRNDPTGEIALRPKTNAKEDGAIKQRLQALLRPIEKNPMPDDFLAARIEDPPRNPFAQWAGTCA